MIDQFFRQPATAQRHRAAPLVGPYLDGVVGQLAALGYARTTVRRYIHACESFGRFLTVHGVELRDLSEAHVEAFLHEVASQRTWRGVPVDRGGRKPRFALVPPGTISRCGLSSSHKTSAHGFDGYKGHVAIDPDVELITATAVTAGNAGDASAAPELLADHPPGGRGTLRGLAPDEHRGGRRSRDPQVGLVGSPALDSGRQGRARARGRVGGGFALSSTLVKERSRAPLPSLAKTGAAAPEPRRATPAARDPITMA